MPLKHAFLDAMWDFGYRYISTYHLERLHVQQNLALIEKYLEQAVRERFLTVTQQQEIKKRLASIIDIANQFAVNNFNAFGEDEKTETVLIINANNEREEHPFTDLFEREFNDLNQQLNVFFHESESRNLKEKIQSAAYFLGRNLIIGSLAIIGIGIMKLCSPLVCGCLLEKEFDVNAPGINKFKNTLQKAWGKRSDIKRIEFSKLTANIYKKTYFSTDAWVGEKRNPQQIAEFRRTWAGPKLAATLFKSDPIPDEETAKEEHIAAKEVYVKQHIRGFTRLR